MDTARIENALKNLKEALEKNNNTCITVTDGHEEVKSWLLEYNINIELGA